MNTFCLSYIKKKYRKCKKIICFVLSVFLSFVMIISVVGAEISKSELPDPVKVVDFSYSFEELAEIDNAFEVVSNDARPVLVTDDEMGQVLKLGKTVHKNFVVNDDDSVSYDTEYSTIKLSNPYKGLAHLKEYEPYEDVDAIEYGELLKPQWKEGITISYWIKSPAQVNSNVIGFTSERFQIQSQDYAYYLATVRFDLEYNEFTDEQRNLFGENVARAGVLPDSVFYFELATDELYNGAPVYKSPDDNHMGSAFWMNKFYIDGYKMTVEGGYSPIFCSTARYSQYNEVPELGIAYDDHNPGNSNLRYGWTKSEMWLDASSSFYYNGDIEKTLQLNPNCADSYQESMVMQDRNRFNINSWKNYSTFEEAYANNSVADSPLTMPDQWNYVSVIIQNDWVSYYLNGEKINVEELYSSFGGNNVGDYFTGYNPWKSFNKGIGPRYSVSANRELDSLSFINSGYVTTTILDWLIMDCTDMTIGGGNINGSYYNMYAETDEILIKNIVFYDQILSDDQIKYLSENPLIYNKQDTYQTGDVDNNSIIDSTDALLVLKHSAKIDILDDEILVLADVNKDSVISADDTLTILKYAASLIEAF